MHTWSVLRMWRHCLQSRHIRLRQYTSSCIHDGLQGPNAVHKCAPLTRGLSESYALAALLLRSGLGDHRGLTDGVKSFVISVLKPPGSCRGLLMSHQCTEGTKRRW